jgi:hypothetical protein
VGKSEFLHKEPCPKCGSGDNLARYADGSAHCFTPGCKYREKPESDRAEAGRGEKPRSEVRADGGGHPATPGNLIVRKPDCYDTPISSRGLECATLRRFGYFPAKLSGSIVHVAPYYDASGAEVAQKVRFVEKKDFTVLHANPEHELIKGWLFGRQVWGDAHHKKIEGSRFWSRVVIVEGEIDTLTVAQVTKFNIPVVSIPTGAQSARKAVAANIDWLEKFDEIILGFDDDEPGRKAVEECAPLIPTGKCKICSWGEEHKDPNGLLMARRPGDIQLCIERARTWAPVGTLTGSSFDRVINEAFSDSGGIPLTFPWPKMRKATANAYRQGDAIIILAGSGVGKSTFLFECMAHWLDEGHNIAGIFLEDIPAGVLDGLLTVASNKRLRLDPTMLSAPEKIALLKARGWYDRLCIEEPDKIAKTKDALYSKVRYLVGARDVSIVIVDPLSFLVSKAVTDTDERRAIDHMMTELSDLGRALGVTIIMSHHLSRPEGNISHEEGAEVSLKHARGSHGIAMFAANIIALQAPNKKKGELAAKVIVKKSRWRGELRDVVVSNLEFDGDTGRLIEITPRDQPGGSASAIDNDFGDAGSAQF